MSRKLLKKWLPAKHHAVKHKHLQSFKHVFDRPEIWSLSRYSVARAVAIGMFVGLLPLIATQMVISGALAIFFRANLLISVAMVWITNPITAAPIYYFCYRVGLIVLSIDPLKMESNWNLTTILHEVNKIWLPLSVGTFVVAVVSSVLSYYAVLFFWRINVALRWKKRKKKT